MRSLLLRCYPARWRARYGDEFEAILDERPLGPFDVADILLGALDAQLRLRKVGADIASRALGLAGILGGAVLLAAFVVDVAPDFNNVRLVLFNLGAIAVVLAVHRRQVVASPTRARTVAGATVLANAWYLSMVVLSIDRPNPFAGDVGLVYFVAGVALWLTDAAFGAVTARLGVVTRWGAIALAIGSVLAFTGIDRFGLTSVANPTIFGPIALMGVALNGLGWILLGLDVATRGRAAVARPQ